MSASSCPCPPPKNGHGCACDDFYTVLESGYGTILSAVVSSDHPTLINHVRVEQVQGGIRISTNLPASEFVINDLKSFLVDLNVNTGGGNETVGVPFFTKRVLASGTTKSIVIGPNI